MALSRGERAARLVRAMGRRAFGSRAGAAVRGGVCVGGAAVETAVFAVRDTAAGDARLARRGRQPLHALQPDPDRAVLRRRRLGHRGGGRRLAAAARRSSIYSSVTPPVLITFAHLSVSSATTLPKSAGLPAMIMPPSSASLALIFGSASPALISLLSLSMISGGVPLGTPMPKNALAS